jgi:hypothetical protein
MFLPLSAVLATAFPAAVFAAGTPKFGYDPNTPISPISWPGLDLGEGVDNQCGGSKQSGIDIPRGSCDYTEANYIFAVRLLSPSIFHVRSPQYRVIFS